MKKFLNDEVKNNITFVKVRNEYVRHDKNDHYKDTYIRRCGDMVTVLTYLFTKNINIQGHIMINLNMILETELGWTKKKIENNIKDVRETLNYMVQEGIFEYDKDFKDVKPNDTILIKRHNFLQITAEKYSQGVYFQVEFNVVDKIKRVSEENKIDFCKLFNLYYSIASRFCNNNQGAPHSGTGTSFPSYIQLTQDTGLSEATIQKYEKILNDNNLIKYVNAGVRQYPDGSYKKSPNIYTAWMEEEYIWEDRLSEQLKYFKDTQSEKYGVIFLGNEKEKTSNEKRSITAKINYLKSKEVLNKKEKSDLKKLEREKAKIDEINNREFVELIDNNSKEINDKSLKILHPEQSLTNSYSEIEKDYYADIAYEEELEKGVINEDGELLKDSYIEDLIDLDKLVNGNKEDEDYINELTEEKIKDIKIKINVWGLRIEDLDNDEQAIYKNYIFKELKEQKRERIKF
jgi:hypothetical protein